MCVNMKKILLTFLVLILLLMPLEISGLKISTLETSSEDEDQDLDAYKLLLKWTKDAYSKTFLGSKKEKADDIFDYFVNEGKLKYGKNSNAKKTEDILSEPYPDGSYYAMCDGLSQVFQDACAVWNIKVYKFWFLLKNEERDIKGIVCKSPGLGRSWDEEEFSETETGPWCFIDELTSYNYPQNYNDFNDNTANIYFEEDLKNSDIDDVNYQEERYYCFREPDGHSINLLKDEDGVHLYDLSFGIRIDNVFDALPLEPDGMNAVKGEFTQEDWANFREKYHDAAVDYYIEELGFSDDPLSNDIKEYRDFEISTKLFDDTWPSPYEISLIPSKIPPVVNINIHCYKDENKNKKQDPGEEDFEGIYVHVMQELFLHTPAIPRTTDENGNIDMIIVAKEGYCYSIFALDKYLLLSDIEWNGEGFFSYRNELKRGQRHFDIGLKRPIKGLITGEIINKKIDYLNATITCTGMNNDIYLVDNTHSFPSSGQHFFRFEGLPVPGYYKIKIQRDGFQDYFGYANLEDKLFQDSKHFNGLRLIPEIKSKERIPNFPTFESMFYRLFFNIMSKFL